jgi:putative CocE/NonD family hydrolase
MAMRKPIFAWFLTVMVFFLPGIWAPAAPEQVSKPGQYSGYSPVLYDGYKLTSQYITVRDGTKIAVDIVRPTLKGVVVDKKMPVIWSYTAYNRRFLKADRAEASGGAPVGLTKYGYVVASADMRGSYASFGRAVTPRRTMWTPAAYMDSYDITEWFAAQPWSDGNIGMWGCSAVGHSQWQVAATHPPHLKAIFPLSAPSEYYEINGLNPRPNPPTPPPAYPGPIPAVDEAAAAVDEDATLAMLKAAKEEHRYNIEPGDMYYRDSASPWMEALLGIRDFKYHLVVNTLTHLPELQKAGIPFYESSNWGEDYRVKQGVLAKLANLKIPSKLIMAGGGHCQWCTDFRAPAYPVEFNINTEELRWFDYWLKGVNNGIMDEPPIYYFTFNAPSRERDWKFAWQWPLPTDQSVRYYLGPGPAEGITSGVNNGTLSTAAPTSAGAKDQYTVDYSVVEATHNQKGMTYTTPALTSDTNLTGNPVIHLWISSTATDGDFLAFLYDVAPDGSATRMPGTEDGQLRASFRKLNTPPYDNLGLPYHRCFAEDEKPLTPGEPAELVFDMAPLSYVFRAGHRIRLVIVCVEVPRHRDALPPTPVLTPAPVVSFHRDPAHRSYITLPVHAPVSATVSFEPRTTASNTVSALIKFPAKMDRRYIQDIKATSIRCNGVPAVSASVKGDTLSAVFSRDNLREGQTMTIQGEFGSKYYYGDMMTFTATGKAPGR